MSMTGRRTGGCRSAARCATFSAAAAAGAPRLHMVGDGLVRRLPRLLHGQRLRLRLPPQCQVALEVLHRQQRAVGLGRNAGAQRLWSKRLGVRVI